MGNIINPSPGDLIDRQTILQVKLDHCAPQGEGGYAPVSDQIVEQSTKKAVSRTTLLDKKQIDIQPFLIEHEAIQQRLQLDWYSKLDGSKYADVVDKLIETLKNINSELWTLEDQARVLRAAPDRKSDTVVRRKAETLDAITVANDLRMDTVKKINALWDIYVQEKLYI